jgi:signal transduction histidine kinase
VPAIQRALKGSPPGPQDMYLRGLQQLVQVIVDLPRARDLDAISGMVCRAARQLSGADAALFVLREAVVCHCVGEDSISPQWKGLHLPVDGCLSGWCMLHREIAVAEDIHTDPRVMRSELRGTGMQSEVAIPMEGEEPAGALALFWRSRHRPNADELKLLQALTQAAAVAVQNLRRLADLERRFRDRGRDLDAVTRELDAFSYAVSHDLRGPLRSVSGFGKLLAKDYEGCLDEAGKNFLAYVTDGTLRISGLVDALLELSRVSRSPMEKRSVDVSALAQEVVAALRRREPARRAEISIEPGLQAEADPRLLRTALESLLGNAWKFTSRRAEAHIGFGRDRGGRDAFYVRDDGAGFEMAYSDKLFTPFQRQHRQDEFEGAGVGLAMVQRIVMRHGGRVWAEAVEGEGATFFFTLEDGPAGSGDEGRRTEPP